MMLQGRCAIWSALVVLWLLTGCESSAGSDEPTTRLVSISHLTSLYDGYPQELSERIAIEGVVISDDRHGEFRHRVVMEDASGGVTVMVASDSLCLLHKVGDILRVECCGLTLGGYGRSPRLGAEGQLSEVAPLSPARWQEVHNLVGVAPQVPLHEITIDELSARYISTRLLLRGVRFVEAGEEWAPLERDTTRHLVTSPHGADTLAVRLSGRSDFAHQPIPEGECTLIGVLDYFHEDYQLLLASPEDVLPHSEK